MRDSEVDGLDFSTKISNLSPLQKKKSHANSHDRLIASFCPWSQYFCLFYTELYTFHAWFLNSRLVTIFLGYSFLFF